MCHLQCPLFIRNFVTNEEAANYNNNWKKIPLIDTDPDMTQMLESAEKAF